MSKRTGCDIVDRPHKRQATVKSIPKDVLQLIFLLCDAAQLLIVLPSVSRDWNAMLKDDNFWKAKCFLEWSSLHLLPQDFQWKKKSTHSWKELYCKRYLTILQCNLL